MANTKKLTKRNPDELNPKQLRFCHEYIIDNNGTQAAIRAGYSAKTADVLAAQLLGKLKVSQKINELQSEVAEKLKIDAGFVMEGFVKLFARCMQEEPARDSDGNPIGEFTFDATNAARALENLGKMTGAYKEDNKQKAVNVLQQLNIAAMPEQELDKIIYQMHTKVIAAESGKKGKL